MGETYTPAALNTYVQRNQPPGVPASGADRGADPPGRPGGELLVPAPPRRVSLDRRTVRGPAGGRHGLRGGLWVRRARGERGGGRGSRCQPRGARACAAALPVTAAAVRALVDRGLRGRRALGCDRLPADRRTRGAAPAAARALRVAAVAGRRRIRQHAQPPHAGGAGSREVRQSLARARVHAGRVPRRRSNRRSRAWT